MKNVSICVFKIKIVVLFALVIPFSFNQAIGQVTVDNNIPTGGAYVGWSGPQDLDFKTDNILRMQLMQTQSSTINGFPGIAQDGFLGLSDQLNFFNPGGTGPFSMLHLNGENDGANPQELGWRPWMHYGMTVTSNRDLMYVGHLDRGTTDETDAVITWSDNTFGPSGPDNLRFIFTSGDGTAAPGDEDSFYGLEAGRFSGEGNFGCGDFSPSGTNEQPTHQLDVNGEVRVRRVPTGPDNVLITGREMDAAGDYVLSHLAFTGNTDDVLVGDGTWVEFNPECDWDIVNTDQDVATGYPGACVERGTGIGTSTPESKLEVDYNGPLPEGFNDYAVEATVNTDNNFSPERIAVKGDARNDLEQLIVESYGGYFSAYGARMTVGVYGESLRSPEWNLGSVNTGVRGVSEDPDENGQNYGVSGYAENAESNIGVRGKASYFSSDGGAQPDYNYGVFGTACRAVRNFGVYGEIPDGCTGVAGFFDGDLQFTGNLIGPSDEMLKTNVEDMETGLDFINELSPKSYNFKTEEFSQMNLPDGMQFGLIAQEVEEILPHLTKTAVHPAKYDEEGNEISPETEYLGVDYLGMVPVLISAVKEQQAIIDSQNETLAQVLDQLDDLQQQINNCCSADGSKNFGSQDDDEKPVFGENILHQNHPNPFRSQTTIRYELEQGGKVVLNIFDRNGKPLATLVEAEQQAGDYRYEWDASGLPAGVYNYALYVDGELLVKKAIKLAD